MDTVHGNSSHSTSYQKSLTVYAININPTNFDAKKRSFVPIRKWDKIFTDNVTLILSSELIKAPKSSQENWLDIKAIEN